MRISDWSSDVCSSDLVPEHDPTQDLLLAQHGAFAPIGRLRLDTAQRFYAAHIDATAAPGFTLQDMVERADVFVEQLAIHRDRKSTRLNSSHSCASRMPSSA